MNEINTITMAMYILASVITDNGFEDLPEDAEKLSADIGTYLLPIISINDNDVVNPLNAALTVLRTAVAIEKAKLVNI